MLASRDNRIAVVERLIDMGVNVNEQAKVSSDLRLKANLLISYMRASSWLIFVCLFGL